MKHSTALLAADAKFSVATIAKTLEFKKQIQ